MVSRSRLIAVWFAFVCAQVALPGAAGAEEVKTFQYKQWQAQCGEAYCTLMPRAEPHFALMRGHRGGPWVLSFETDADATGRILIDGLEMRWKAGQKMPFPEILLDGDIFEIADHEQGKDTGFSVGSSLAGIKAALIWAEEQQPATKMARFLELRQPDWASLTAEARQRTLGMCDSAELPDQGDLQPVPGHPEVRLFSQLCWTAAYNVGSNVYLLGPMIDGVDPVRPAARAAGEPVQELGLYSVEAPTDRLESGFKGRGLGDCFTYETWRFDGFHYSLEQRISDDDCDRRLIPYVVWPD